MSLVSDALKKAQRDAALREAKEKGLPEPLLAAAQPFRAKRPGLPALPLALALGAAALLAVGGSYFFQFRNQDERLPVKGVGAPTAAPEGAHAAPERTPPRVPPPDVGAGPGVPGVAPIRGPVAGRVDAPPAAPPLGSVPESAPTGSTSAAPTPAPPAMEASGKPIAGEREGATPALPTPAPKAQGTRGEQVFVRVARLANGTEVRLGGIAWSETAPLAYLNGKLLGTSESVAGLRVVRIERDRVRLEGAGSSVVLTLR